jgi:contact-dependent growth inhibition (CDI) system CdiI-like immunity protein
MKRGHPKKGLTVAPADFPALAEFFAAYLHQDFHDEYGSAADAAKQYLGDATRQEAEGVRAEWVRFRSTLAGQPLSEVQSAIAKLGAAWRPDSPSALADFDVALKS